MHPDDERSFVDFLLQEEAVQFVDGPRWPTSAPPTTREISSLSSNYCIVWAKTDIKRLRAQFMRDCGDWYCSSEQATIQFLRSEMFESNVVTEGRIAVGTPSVPTKGFPVEGIERLERRYKLARKYIQSNFRNSALAWYSSNHPRRKEGSKWINPSEPDKQVWLGPIAEAWLRADTSRKLQQHYGGSDAILVDYAEYG